MITFLKKHRSAIVYILTVLFSILYIVFGSKIASRSFYFGNVSTLEYSATVLRVIDVQEGSYALSGSDKTLTSEQVAFEARVTSGSLKGITVTATQQRDSIVAVMPKRVEAGDNVVLSYASDSELDENGNVVENGNYIWTFVDYNRLPGLLWLGGFFFFFLLLFGRKKGVNTIVSLVFTCLAIFAVFVPSILSGYNIYLSSAITCLFIIVMTLLIVVGATKKGLCAAVGCAGGVAVTAVLTTIMSKVLQLTGLADEQSIYITMLDSVQIDLKALLFGAIIVGAVGAVMDVSMSLSSSLLEVSEQMAEKRSFKKLFRSGMTIGRDIMGTMANTLILAYIGSSLSVVILLVASETSLLSLFNREMIVEEIMQALTGSFGILFTIPLTSLFAAFLYSRKTKADGGKKPSAKREKVDKKQKNASKQKDALQKYENTFQKESKQRA